MKYAKEKQHRDKTIGKFQGVQMSIAQMAEKTEAARGWYTVSDTWPKTMKDLRELRQGGGPDKIFCRRGGRGRLPPGHGRSRILRAHGRLRRVRIYRDMIIAEQVEGVMDLQRVITGSLLLS